MHNANDFLNAVKKAAKDAVDAGQPCDFLFGKVTSEDPLEIFVEQKMTLKKKQLILTRNVTDFETKVTIKEDYEWETKDEDGHKHDIALKEKYIKFHNKLKVDDEVVLVKKQGGQKYLVLDRLEKK